MMQNGKFKRITAWIAVVVILFVMLFSFLYILKHADHECTGADCPICAVMAQCEDNIKNIGTVIAVITAVFFLCLSIQKCVQYEDTTCFFGSLISQKVRMNN